MDPSAVAGTILNEIGSSFPIHRTLMTNLPAEEQNPQHFSNMLTEAEKNEMVQDSGPGPPEMSLLPMRCRDRASAAVLSEPLQYCHMKWNL